MLSSFGHIFWYQCIGKKKPWYHAKPPMMVEIEHHHAKSLLPDTTETQILGFKGSRGMECIVPAVYYSYQPLDLELTRIFAKKTLYSAFGSSGCVWKARLIQKRHALTLNTLVMHRLCDARFNRICVTRSINISNLMGTATDPIHIYIYIYKIDNRLRIVAIDIPALTKIDPGSPVHNKMKFLVWDPYEIQLNANLIENSRWASHELCSRWLVDYH